MSSASTSTSTSSSSWRPPSLLALCLSCRTSSSRRVATLTLTVSLSGAQLCSKSPAGRQPSGTSGARARGSGRQRHMRASTNSRPASCTPTGPTIELEETVCRTASPTLSRSFSCKWPARSQPDEQQRASWPLGRPLDDHPIGSVQLRPSTIGEPQSRTGPGAVSSVLGAHSLHTARPYNTTRTQSQMQISAS